jgi:hypothetical protein
MLLMCGLFLHFVEGRTGSIRRDHNLSNECILSLILSLTNVILPAKFFKFDKLELER